MTINRLLSRARSFWSRQKRLVSPLFAWRRPCKKTTAALLASLRFFLNSPHFPTLFISLAIVVGIFVNFVPRPSLSEQGFLKQPGHDGPQREATLALVHHETLGSPHAYTEISGTLRPGDTLSTSFKRHRISEAARLQIIRSLTGLLDFKDLRPHDHFKVIQDENGALVQCQYESGPLNVLRIMRTDDGRYVAEKAAIPLERQTVKITGEVRSSLYAAFLPFHEDAKLIYSFADIFASKIDFNTETRHGDKFSLVFEKYFKDGQFVGYGKILVARYERVNNEALEGFYYEPAAGRGSYFDQDGRELGASFIRSPVPMARISSRFSYRRLHPILKTVRPHLGIDLAAPTGTPIMAAADGRVRRIGRNGGFGNQIVLDHGGGYRTYYGHLSRYKKGLRVGSRVQQKQIIGYVGSTGLATGPHLDYRLRHNGVFQNPFALKFKPRSVLQGAELKQFQQKAAVLARFMDMLDAPRIMQVKNITVTPDMKISFL